MMRCNAVQSTRTQEESIRLLAWIERKPIPTPLMFLLFAYETVDGCCGRVVAGRHGACHDAGR